jgi:FeS assembly SUF system regulator
MLRISKLTDYATVILGALATEPDRQRTAAEIAARTHVGAATVAKLLKQLHRAELVASSRGLHGGYRLARPAQEISAAAILDALEGPLALTECAAEHSHCGIEGTCRVGGAWQRVSLAIRHSLQEITLAELAGLDSGKPRFAAFDARLRRGMGTGAGAGAGGLKSSAMKS